MIQILPLLGKVVSGLAKIPSALLSGLVGFGTSAYMNHKQEELNKSLTGAQKEQNQWNAEQAAISRNFNAAEAQKSRDFTQFMARNKYSMETQSMQEAGVNPALVYGGGSLVPTAANGAQASSSAAAGQGSGNAGIFNIVDMIEPLMAMIRMPQELKKLVSEVDRNDKEGKAREAEAKAAVVNADANALKAKNDERRISLEERGLDIKDKEVAIQKALADKKIEVDDATISRLAADTAYIQQQAAQLPKYLEIAEKNSDTAAKQASAALISANAAMKNAETNESLAEGQKELYAAEAALKTAMKNTYEENLKWLPQEKAQQIENMKKQGIVLDKQGNLIDKEGRLVDAKMRREYVQLGCDVINAGCNVVGTVATGGVGGAFVKGPQPASSPAFGGAGTAYDGVYGTFGD